MKKLYQRIYLALFRKKLSREIAAQWLQNLDALCADSQKVFEGLHEDLQVPLCDTTRKDLFFHRGVLTKHFLRKKIIVQLWGVDSVTLQATINARFADVDTAVAFFETIEKDNRRMIHIDEQQQCYVPDHFKELIKNTTKISI